MHPVLLQFECFGHPITLKAYSTAMAAAAATIVVLGTLGAWRHKLPLMRSGVVMLAVGAAVPIGSWAAYWALATTPADDPGGMYVARSVFSGFLLPGGMAAAVLVGALLCRLLRLDAWRLFDSAAPAFGLAGVVQRTGCFLNGCCFGKESSLPWAVTYPFGSPVHGYQAANSFLALIGGPRPVHPTPVYEALAALVAASVAIVLLRRHAPDGVPVLAAGAWFLAFRWFNSNLRVADPSYPLAGAASHAFYGALLLLLLAGLAWRARRTGDRQV